MNSEQMVIESLQSSIVAFGERISRSTDPREVAQLQSYRRQAQLALAETRARHSRPGAQYR